MVGVVRFGVVLVEIEIEGGGGGRSRGHGCGLFLGVEPSLVIVVVGVLTKLREEMGSGGVLLLLVGSVRPPLGFWVV